jgi:hypothetical protein
MRGGITPLPSTPSWRGAQLKKSTGTTLFNCNFIVLNPVILTCINYVSRAAYLKTFFVMPVVNLMPRFVWLVI